MASLLQFDLYAKQCNDLNPFGTCKCDIIEVKQLQIGLHLIVLSLCHVGKRFEFCLNKKTFVEIIKVIRRITILIYAHFKDMSWKSISVYVIEIYRSNYVKFYNFEILGPKQSLRVFVTFEAHKMSTIQLSFDIPFADKIQS